MKEKKNPSTGFILDPFGRPVSAAAWEESERRNEASKRMDQLLKKEYKNLLEEHEGKFVAFDEDGVIEVVTTQEEANGLANRFLTEKRTKLWIICLITRDMDLRTEMEDT